MSLIVAATDDKCITIQNYKQVTKWTEQTKLLDY
jgi:hypothetical protein